MMDPEGPEIWHTRTYFAPCCPAKVLHRPNSVWSLDQFIFRSQIGAGQASIVYLVRDTVADANLALKCYPGAAAKPDVRLQVAHEIGIHAQLQHPNILPLYGAFVENDDILLIMPYAAQGSVYRLLRAAQTPFAEDFAVSCIIRPFLSGVAYLHSLGIMHRDIKTENVVVDEHSHVMIADFGLAIDTHTTTAHLRVGTPLYMAPEVFNVQSNAHGVNWTQISGPGLSWSHVSGCNRATEPAVIRSKAAGADGGRRYSDKADCWSAAVFVYEVLTGSTPFAHIHHRQALQRAVLFSPISPPAHLSAPARAFLTWALNRTPQLRPSIEQMSQHPWLFRGHSEPSHVLPQAAERAPLTSSQLRPASAPHGMAHPTTCFGVGTFPGDDANAAELSSCLKGCPSRRVIGFAPAIASGDPSTVFSSLQSTGDVRTGEAAQLGDMHRAVIEALRLRSPSPSLTPRTHSSSRPLHKSASTRSCANASSSSDSGGALTVRAQSARMPCPPAALRPPPRVSSLTQALLLQRDASCSDLQSPLLSLEGPQRHAAVPSSVSPSPCHTSALATAAADAAVAPPSLPRRPLGVPCATVTVIYACDEPASPEMEECVLPCLQEGARELNDIEHGCGSGLASMHPTSEAPPVWRAAPEALPPAPDSVMQQVAATVFMDCTCSPPLPSRSADKVLMRERCPTATEPRCPHREAVGGRCGNCQAAADLASIWQRAAEPSPIQRQMHPLESLQPQLSGPAAGHGPDGERTTRTVGRDADCAVSAPANQIPADAAAAVLPRRSEAGRTLLDITTIGGDLGSGDEERCYEVRGSWGGSIDSTAGAMFARLSKRLEAVTPAESGSVGGVKGRVASWVANAAAAMWDPVSDLSSDSKERSCNDAPGETAVEPWGHSHVDAGGLHAALAKYSPCGNSGDGMTASVAGGTRGEALKMWETGTADMSRELDAAASEAHSLMPGPSQCAAMLQQAAMRGSNGEGTSSMEDNSVSQTTVSAAPGVSSVGCAGGGSRPCLQSYGIDSSTVSLHALAAALTPSMTDPSLLRASPVYPESRNV